MCLKSQNSGVLVRGNENTGNLDYFGVLTDITELGYSGGNNVILFRCDWWDVYSREEDIKKTNMDLFLLIVNVNGRLMSHMS